MGGVVAGTAILEANGTGQLHTVTLTINNQCNLKCRHCYLHYHGTAGVVAPEIIEYLFAKNTSLRRVVIAGMEPLVTRDSAQVCSTIIARAKESGISVSLITNGLNLPWLGENSLAQLDFMDVSLDGGYETYSRYRGAGLDKIERGLAWAEQFGYDRINALEVLNTETLAHVDDMMDFAAAKQFRKIMFSPYVPAAVDGCNSVSMVTLRQTLDALRKSSAFMSDDRALLLIDVYHCWFEGITMAEALLITKQMKMIHKVHFVQQDPTDLGVMRLTYDGLVMSSFDALYTLDYKARGRPFLTSPTLDDHYSIIRKKGLLPSARRKAA